MRPNETSNTAASTSSWQEEAARFLLRSGFKPMDTVGQIQDLANPHKAGRTFGSVWRAMRESLDGELESPAKAELGRASPAEAMRLHVGGSIQDPRAHRSGHP